MNIKDLAIKIWNPFHNSASDFLSLKITERDIKMMQMKRVKSSYEVLSAVEIPTPDMSVMENVIMDSALVSKSIIECMSKGKFKAKDVSIGLNSNEVIVKKIAVPVMPEKDIIDYVTVEVANHIPYRADDVYVDYVKLLPLPNDPTRMELFLIACKKEVVNTYRDVLSLAGLNLKYVDCDVFALYNLHQLNMNNIEEDEKLNLYSEDVAQAFVNIGYSSSSIVIVYKNVVKLASSAGFGTKFIDVKISDELYSGEIDHERLTELKKGHIDDYISFYYDYFDYITGELLRAFNHYNSSNPEFPVDHVHISGGGVLFEGALTEIESRLGTRVTLFNPFASDLFILKDKNKFGFDVERDGYRFALCSGLSIK